MSEMQKDSAGSRQLILQDSIFENEIKRRFALQGIEDIGYSRDGGCTPLCTRSERESRCTCLRQAEADLGKVFYVLSTSNAIIREIILIFNVF